MTNILFVVGSLRAASASRATARALADRLGTDATAVFADIGALPHYNADLAPEPAVETLIAQIGDADGVVFVTPEYNYGVPGVLKNAIDWASRPAFESVFVGRKCLVVTVSGGALGGVRAQADLKYTLNGMLAETFPCKEIVVPMANAEVVDGKLADEAILSFAGDILQDFLSWLELRR